MRTLVLSVLIAGSLLIGCKTVVDSEKPAPSSCFLRVTGGALEDDAASVRQTSDGGYIVLATTASRGAGALDCELIKLDANGIVEWDSTYGANRDEVGNCVRQTADGGYILVGSTLSHSGSYNVYIVKTDAVGRLQWEQNYGGSGEDVGYGVVQLPDGGYAIGGTTRNPANQSYDFYLIRLDALGGKRWEKSLPVTGGGYEENCYDIARTADGGFVMVGNQVFSGNPRIAFIKTDSVGNPQVAKSWLNTYGTARSVEEVPGFGYRLFGFTQEIGVAFTRASAIVVTAAGDFSVGGEYGTRGRNEFNAGKRTADGGSIAVGFTNSIGSGGLDILLTKFDAAGNQQWSHAFGGPDDDTGLAVETTADGGYIVVGTSNSFGSDRTKNDVMIIKVDANGELCN